MRLLLDTNVVVWLLLGDHDAVPSEVSATIASPDSDPFVSAASVWEIAIKRSLEKLTIPPGWPQALTRLDLTALPVTAEHAARVQDLAWHHRDPFDRLLVAQAMVEDCTVVTSDRQLDAYEVDTLWAGFAGA